METLLNLVWVLVSACGIYAGIAHLSARRVDRPAAFHSAVALLLVAVLLFPVISLSDDLRPVTFAREDISRRSALSTLEHSPALQNILFLGLCVVLFVASLVLLGAVMPYRATAKERIGFFHCLSPRAPPASC